MDLNPYQSPSIAADASEPKRRWKGNPPWRDGDQMVVSANDLQFEEVCVRTGATSDLARVNAVLWGASSRIVDPYVTRSAHASLGWKSMVDLLNAGAVVLTVVAFLGLIVGRVFLPDWLSDWTPRAFGIGLLFVGLGIPSRLAFFEPFLWITKVEDGYLWVRGAHPGYLDRLPSIEPDLGPIAPPIEAWRDRDQLVIPARWAEFPRTCILTGSEEGLVRASIQSRVFTMLRAGWEDLAPYVSQKWLSERWNARRRLARMLTRYGMATVLLTVPFVVVVPHLGLLSIVGGIGVWIGLSLREDAAPSLSISRIRNGMMWIEGAHPVFLAKLPPWT